MPSSTPHPPPGARTQPAGRFGGARADFVASLGRKVNDARDLLTAIEEDPSTKPAREELRRRLHALGAGARLLRFEAMTQSLQEALAVLDRGAQAGALREEDVGFVAQVLDDLPTLVCGDLPREPAADPGREPTEAQGAMPVAVLVVGEEDLARALSAEGPGRPFEVERIAEVDTVLELARSYGPDVVLVDVDVAGAPALVEALLDDPLTSPLPVVVIGTFRAPDELARFVALGAARTLPKPVANDVVRATCDEVAVTRDGPTMRVTLGEPTLEQLADRLAQELKRALVDSVAPPARSLRVPLGEGTEVLGAFWGAIARIQEIVSEKTSGTVRFGGEAPEGAIALAPVLHQDVAGADRAAGRGRGAAVDVRLQGRRVVVADDDPGVTWFVADLLRTAGCEVFEALDGAAALELAFRVQPELVVSDILMPEMDGFALCRALRRDVAVRDTPVILLSWKEDLLQRVRELGASAAAYMRKETGSRAILARVREVLRPRARIEARLRGEGEVRGRLDGLTPRVLLELVCLTRGDARLALRDATYLYEIDVRGGAPRRATRTASDGSYRSGERALASLLGVGAGRFVVTSSREALRGELSGTLSDQLARPIAMARAALAATTGARTMSVTRLLFDEESLDDYLRATPEPTRSLIGRLAQGVTPRRLLLGGEAAPGLVEDVLADLAARGAIRGVFGEGGDDLLGPAFDRALAVLKGGPRARQSMPPNARSSAAVPAARPVPPNAASAPAGAGPAPQPWSSPESVLPPVASASLPPFRPPEPSFLSLTVSDPPPPATAVESDPAPSSLEDALMRELSERRAEPHPPDAAS
ncbi:MAG: response regulator, partial [Myxococcales bacterium]|nr:response regulator [Myxococcales bacterium]